MTSEEDQNGNGLPDDDEVPPPKIIKIEDSAGLNSPYESLDGEILTREDAVAVARLDAESITAEGGDGVLVGRSIADLAYIIGELGNHSGDVRVREVAFGGNVDIGFTATEVESVLGGLDSASRRGAVRLVKALASADSASLLRTLDGVKEPLVVRLEALLKLLFKYQATMDMQTPSSAPARVVPERAYALYHALREPIILPHKQFVRAGRLVGAIADTKYFKLRLDEKWTNRSVIEGKFRDGLEVEMEGLWNKDVLAWITPVEERRGVRTGDYRFTLDALQAAPRLPFR